MPILSSRNVLVKRTSHQIVVTDSETIPRYNRFMAVSFDRKQRREMAVACDLTISFAAAGNSLAYLGGGWARSEDEFTWGVGAESHLMFPRLAAGRRLRADARCGAVRSPARTAEPAADRVGQRYRRRLDRHRSPTLLGYRFPASLARRSDRMVVTLQHPDAARPMDFSGSADDRPLAFAAVRGKALSRYARHRPLNRPACRPA